MSCRESRIKIIGGRDRGDGGDGDGGDGDGDDVAIIVEVVGTPHTWFVTYWLGWRSLKKRATSM